MVRGKEVRFKEPLMLDNEMIDGQLCLSHQELNLFVYGYQIHEELAMLWEEYALAPDEELTEDAIALKEKLLRMVEE